MPSPPRTLSPMMRNQRKTTRNSNTPPSAPCITAGNPANYIERGPKIATIKNTPNETLHCCCHHRPRRDNSIRAIFAVVIAVLKVLLLLLLMLLLPPPPPSQPPSSSSSSSSSSTSSTPPPPPPPSLSLSSSSSPSSPWSSNACSLSKLQENPHLHHTGHSPTNVQQLQNRARATITEFRTKHSPTQAFHTQK